jgi:hypothetical protein
VRWRARIPRQLLREATDHDMRHWRTLEPDAETVVREASPRPAIVEAALELIWSDLVKLSRSPFWFFVFCALASHVPAGAARRDSHLAGTARSGQGRAVVWRDEANP